MVTTRTSGNSVRRTAQGSQVVESPNMSQVLPRDCDVYEQVTAQPLTQCYVRASLVCRDRDLGPGLGLARRFA